MTAYVTVKDVEIVSTGRQWMGNGVFYVTAEHLADMVAAQADPLIRKPRAKLGHQNELWQSLAAMHDPSDLADGEPAFGSFTNLRLVEGGAKIIGDLEECPGWLASALPSAYPTRSAEWIWDHTTQGGSTYRAVLTDIALGSWRPAVEDLGDVTRAQATAALQALLERGPEGADAALAAIRQENHVPEPALASAQPASASVSADRIAGAFQEWAEIEHDDGIDRWWWWARDVRVDPDEVIASDGEGGTYRIPFATDGEHAVTFGEPVEVRQAYLDLAPTAAMAAAGARTSQQIVAHDLPRPTKAARPTAASRHITQEGPMDIDPSILRSRLGLSEDATEDQIIEALDQPVDTSDTPAQPAAEETTPDTGDDTAKGDDSAQDAAPADREPVAASADTVTLSRPVFEAMQSRLSAIETAEATRVETETRSRRDGIAASAVTEGRIAPAERSHYRQLLDVDETRTGALLSSLQPGRIPVGREVGSSATAMSTSDVPADEDLPEALSLLSPAERAARA